MGRRPVPAVAAAVSIGILALPGAGQAQQPRPDDWAQAKCALYADAWQRVLAHRDLGGVRADFVAGHQRFVDSGCDAAIRVCPRTAAELALADLLTVLSMNEGMASTFVPFECPN